jgi:AcrR family transcriptional regulator
MPEKVKPVRSYHSPRRAAQAAATRQVILEAAQRLFEQQGYPATTMAAIADEAGVALKTVYLAFETKSGVVRALWQVLLGGVADDAPVAQRDWYREVMHEPDPRRVLLLNARNARVVKERAGGLMSVVRDAAPSDPDLAALWELIQSDFHANQASIVELLHRKKALRPRLSVARATDILWSLNHPDLWHLLVVVRQWTAPQYERWVADCACQQLLRSP